ncbi:peptidoglycan DD-metalloendopeptidase family protein [Coxiella burnetii]|uniref:Peptidoglycan-specific endopeptidase, M23 family n=1 Tax=Coxiella burnetii (strain Dugway 5J108-111) TaxID=434922 RepID=A9KDI0_COXBN|nr:peptidoglycan DD-metalloendopeptidase family protein [Coxiella burnetii]ABS76802.1 peptidoglycan-specific endopeptidase, M23 family [Coxiella burnetii Dugway 5J108-111]ACJ19642.1 peptidoglycan-specific endopeptidase, M23 family [Coxiella burnetii CbuK_Q154]AIT62667.1 Putative lipoprotein [Coxiella burnetii str. Namibia]ATN85297.1 peptidase [Coxiella burnetii str. Schperling]EAX33178.1 peptidase [Coxiella burnetii 'MSU Goat Q177']
MKRCLVVIIIAFLLCGCVESKNFAPVVNGWLQPKARLGSYRVKQGDTIYSIAWAFGLDYRALAAANRLSPPYRIEAGQTLQMTIIPRGAHVSGRFAAAPRWQSPPPLQPVAHWRWPAKGRLIGHYSVGMAGNQGINIAGHYGEAVRAASDGVVVYSGAGIRGYGNLIIVKHTNTYLSAYAFNKRILVKEGSRVRAGQKIAEMGRTNSGRVMLHFEIRRNGQPVNPLRYLS